MSTMDTTIARRPVPHDGRYAASRILVVDDQSEIAQLVVHMIELGLGAKVVSAGSGEAAREAVTREHFDVVLTDMRMPGLHGVALVQALLEARPGLSIIGMTGFPVDFPYVDVTKAGAEDIVNKPFQTEELIARLIRILEGRFDRYQRKVAEHKYRSLFELALDGKVLLQGEDFRIVDANLAFLEATGRTREALAAATIFDLLDANDQQRFRAWLEICQVTGRGVLGDISFLRSDGAVIGIDVSATFVPIEEEKILFLSCKDVTERREVSQRLADAAQKDELSGLFNKRSFNGRLEHGVARAVETGAPLALMMIDLDNFKRCNDTFGHAAGDRILKYVGTAIGQSIRDLDAGFRFGGDEFGVVFDGASISAAAAAAQRIREAFAANDTCGVTMSVGVAQFRLGMDAAALLRAADEALYCAKGKGKDAVHAA